MSRSVVVGYVNGRFLKNIFSTIHLACAINIKIYLISKKKQKKFKKIDLEFSNEFS
jgi:hypothetical protein